MRCQFKASTFEKRYTALCKKAGVGPRATMIEILEMDPSNLSRWRNDVSIPNCNVIVAVADYFNVSADYLLGRTACDPSVDAAIVNGLEDRLYALKEEIETLENRLANARP